MILSLAVIAGLAVAYALNFQKNATAEIVESDEANWIFCSYFYHLAFEKRDFKSPDWQTQEAYSHPPLAKFIIGFALARHDLQQKSMDILRWRRDNTFFHATLPGRQEVEMLRRIVPMAALVIGRRLCCQFAFLANVILFAIGWLAFSPAVGAIAAFYFAGNALARAVADFVVSDSILLFFILATILLQLLWERSRDRTGRFFLSGLLGIVSAMALNTKINGILCFGTTVLMMLCLGLLERDAPSRRRDRRSVLMATTAHLALATAAFVAASLALNPTLWGNPLHSLAGYFELRDYYANTQMKLFFPQALFNLPLRVSYTISMFLQTDVTYRFVGIPLGIPFMAVGIFSLPRSLREKGASAAVALINIAIWTSATIYTLRLAWVRYLYVALPFASILVGLGVERTAALILERPGMRKQELAALAAFCLAFCASAYLLQAYVTPARYFASHPQELQDLVAQRLRMQQEFSGRQLIIPPAYLTTSNAKMR